MRRSLRRHRLLLPSSQLQPSSPASVVITRESGRSGIPEAIVIEA
jgi:hypothetical protein